MRMENFRRLRIRATGRSRGCSKRPSNSTIVMRASHSGRRAGEPREHGRVFERGRE
jgi:hypothetical protein